MTYERAAATAPLDTSSRAEFYDYYAQASLSEATLQRYRQIRDTIFRVIGAERARQPLDVADVGCGAGAQCFLWAEQGHRVHGLDVNACLIELARQRAEEKGLEVSLTIGTATGLPWADASMDVCIMPELLEHVEDWRRCLGEAARILRLDGVLFVTTTNWLCPVQEEFILPLYSWYPAPVKRYFERLARTTRPELANYATYPAVNWFSFRLLRSVLGSMGFHCLDRFDTASVSEGVCRRITLSTLRTVPFLRALAQIASPYTQVVAIKHSTDVDAACGGSYERSLSRRAPNFINVTSAGHPSGMKSE